MTASLTPAGRSRPFVSESSGTLTTVVLVGPSGTRPVSGLLSELATMGVLGTTPLVLVHAPGTTREIALLTSDLPMIRALPAASGRSADLHAAAAQLTHILETRYVLVREARPGSSLRGWWTGAEKNRVALDRLDLPPGLPVLVPTPRNDPALFRAYIEQALRAGWATTSDAEEYLGSLYLRAVSPIMEAADPRPDGIEVRVWARNQLAVDTPRPGWRLRLRLVDDQGGTHESEPVALAPRAARLRGSTWEQVVAQVSLRGLRSGSYRFEVGLDTAHSVLRRQVPVLLRKGGLLDSRPLYFGPDRVGTGGPDAARRQVPVRLRLHPDTEHSTPLLTVAVGGDATPSAWARVWRRRDLADIRGQVLDKAIRHLVLARMLTAPLLRRRPIWLIGERYDTAADNGMHLFRHLRSQEKRRPGVYYVIDRDSPQRERVAGWGRVIAHSSWRHRLLMLHATVLADAYSLHYLVPRQWSYPAYARHLSWRIGALRVYLKHGVHLSPRALPRVSTGYHLVHTAIPGESAAITELSGYGRQVRETGLPRYDALVPTPRSRTVLFMSTWRRYLVPEVSGALPKDYTEFAESSYRAFMTAFLADPALSALLERHDYRLLMLPHYQLAGHVAQIPRSPRVELADPERISFQDLLRSCDAFITDHSSSHFDVAYLGTPIVYARFDQEEFERRHAQASWFDFERDGYGPVARTVRETVDRIAEVLGRDCAPDPVYQERLERAFAHRDQENAARVVRAIDAELEASRAGIWP